MSPNGGKQIRRETPELTDPALPSNRKRAAKNSAGSGGWYRVVHSQRVHTCIRALHAYTPVRTREIGGFGIRSEAPVGFMPYSLRSDTATRRVTPQTRGWRRKRRGPFPHPRGDRSRCLHLPLPATCLPCNEPMFAGHLLPYATVTARRYINDRRTADADKPRSGPLCHGERERESFPW